MQWRGVQFRVGSMQCGVEGCAVWGEGVQYAMEGRAVRDGAVQCGMGLCSGGWGRAVQDGEMCSMQWRDLQCGVGGVQYGV